MSLILAFAILFTNCNKKIVTPVNENKKVEITGKWHAVHLIGYNTDEKLWQLCSMIPQLSEIDKIPSMVTGLELLKRLEGGSNL